MCTTGFKGEYCEIGEFWRFNAVKFLVFNNNNNNDNDNIFNFLIIIIIILFNFENMFIIYIFEVRIIKHFTTLRII